jgi:hypothetical protein
MSTNGIVGAGQSRYLQIIWCARDGRAAAAVPPLPSAGAARRRSLSGDHQRLPLQTPRSSLRTRASANSDAAAAPAATTTHTDATAAGGEHLSSS